MVKLLLPVISILLFIAVDATSSQGEAATTAFDRTDSGVDGSFIGVDVELTTHDTTNTFESIKNRNVQDRSFLRRLDQGDISNDGVIVSERRFSETPRFYFMSASCLIIVLCYMTLCVRPKWLTTCCYLRPEPLTEEELRILNQKRRQQQLEQHFVKYKVQLTLSQKNFRKLSREELDKTHPMDDLEDGFDSIAGDDANDEMAGRQIALPVSNSKQGQNKSTTTTKAAQHQNCSERHISNRCAICLERYQLNDVIVWSSNPDCPHVYHRDCLVRYLVKVISHDDDNPSGNNSNNDSNATEEQLNTPCPCCRQCFCLVPKDEQELTKTAESAVTARTDTTTTTTTTTQTTTATATTPAPTGMEQSAGDDGTNDESL